MKLVILDYISGTPMCYDLGDNVTDWDWENYEDFMMQEGFDLSNIQWMTTEKDINLKHFTL